MPVAIDLTGQTFGRLKALQRCPDPKNSNRTAWLCKCECGRKTTVETEHLRSGNTKSCGCGKYKGHKPDDLAGRRFGKLTAKQLLKKKSSCGRRLWRCWCQCAPDHGRGCKVSANQLTTGRTKSCGCARRLTKSKAKADHRKIVHDEDGVPYYAPRHAARVLGIHITTFYPNKHRVGWKTDCPFNGGEGLPTKLLPNALGREFEHFHGPTIDKVKAAMVKGKLVPDYPGLTYIGEEAERLGVSERTVRERLKSKGLRVTKKPGKAKNGHVTRRTYVPNAISGETNGQAVNGQATIADSSTKKAFQPNDRQREILDFLNGRAKKLAQLSELMRIAQETIAGDYIPELKEHGLVAHKRGLGYYRPDAPPT